MNTDTAFKDLGDVYNNKDFILDPYPFLKDIYLDENLKGFRSNGMNFLIRHEDAKALLMRSDVTGRAPLPTEEGMKLEELYAVKYPARAFAFAYTFTDMKAKAITVKYLGEVVKDMDFSLFEPMFTPLSDPSADLENYLEAIASLPMRVLLDAWGFKFTEAELEGLYHHGTNFVKSFDDYSGEASAATGNQCMQYVLDYLDVAMQDPRAGSFLEQFLKESDARGIDINHTKGSLSSVIVSIGNTLTVTTSYMLRNLIRFPNIRQQLKANPALCDENTTIYEFVRRDNHVKSLSRQVYEPFEINGLELRKGEGIYLFYPGINLDPNHWDAPLEMRLDRDLGRDNQLLFGAGEHICIAARASMVYLKAALKGLVKHIPDELAIADEKIEVDYGWVTERVITHMPLQALAEEEA